MSILVSKEASGPKECSQPSYLSKKTVMMVIDVIVVTGHKQSNILLCKLRTTCVLFPCAIELILFNFCKIVF